MTPGNPSLASRIERRLRYVHARQNLQRDFARVMAGTPAATEPAAAGPIGFATLSSGPWHLVIETLLAHALRRRGARTHLLLCDLPDLPACDERTIASRSRNRCDGCVDDKRALLDAAGLEWSGLSHFVSASAIERARAIVNAIGDEDLLGHVERGWPVGRWLHVSASHYLRRDAAAADAETIDARRRLLASAIVTVEGIERWLDWLEPATVVVEGGAHVMWRIAFEVARQRGIPVISREMGKGGWDQHLYALNRDSLSPDLSAAWQAARSVPLTPDAERAVDEYVDTLPQRTFRSLERRPAAAFPEHGDRTRTIVAFSNVTWDLATAGRDVAFSGVADWLRETIAACAGIPDLQLVVRPHPAEAAAFTRERVAETILGECGGALPSNVHCVAADDGVTARELCERADLVTVYNSSAGLEAAARGCPVLVCGRPHYRGKGFTVDVDSREGYRALLRNGVPVGEESRTLARRYCHLFYLRYHVPMGWTTSPLDPPYALTIQSADELAPGRNRVLDLVCDGILHGRQVLLPIDLAAGTTPCLT